MIQLGLHQRNNTMYGLIGKITAQAGTRDELADVLVDASSEMSGCLSYVVAKDPGASDVLWVTEVWESKESHQAALQLPAVRLAIERGRPLIAGFGPERFETEPIGGHGLVRPS